MALSGDQLLITRPVADLIPEQVAKFTVESLRARAARQFDPRLAHDVLAASGTNEVIAIDIGGDKLVVTFYRVRAGNVEPKGDAVVRQDEGGRGYVEYLAELAGIARRDKLPVGISLAGPVEGTRLLAAPNLPVMFDDLHDRYAGDFANLFPSVAVANDAEAGLMAASVEAVKRYPGRRHVAYVINGSGLGGAVLKDDTIFACEPGHIEADARLNPVQISKPCGLLGSTHVCLEHIAASKAGIEGSWLQRRGEPAGGRRIATRYLAGDPFALDLYDNSARVTAHVVAGLVGAFRLALDQTTVVAHGGIFEVPGYGERLCSTLARAGLLPPLALLFTKDFSSNACLDGAAIAALVREGQQGPRTVAPEPSHGFPAR